MKIDIMVPSYRVGNKSAEKARQDLIAYSSCRCWTDGAQLASAFWRIAKGTLKVRPQEVPDENPFHHPSECPHGKHDIIEAPSVASCVIHWTRNELLKLRRSDADFVLFVDDDIVVEPHTLERMLAYGHDIVAGLCTRRQDPPEPNFRQWLDEMQGYGVIRKWGDHGKLRRVDAVGTGLMLVSRKVIEHMALAYHPEMFRQTGNGFWFEFLKNPQGGEWGEDMSFCWKATRLGYPIWVDTGITPQHLGDYGYTVEDFFPYEKAWKQAATGEHEPREVQKLDLFEPAAQSQ